MAAVSATIVGAALGSVAVRRTGATTQVWIATGGRSRGSLRNSRTIRCRSHIVSSSDRRTEGRKEPAFVPVDRQTDGSKEGTVVHLGTASQARELRNGSQGGLPVNLVAGVGITAAVFMMTVLGFMAKPSSNGGSVADLIRRGQLRSDRGTNSKTLMYDDPFNNPLVNMGGKNPIVKMCGKLFRLAPVTLTEEKVLKHQNRRIQAYKWKRPIVFLNEGEPVPEGVDPEEVRWIPSNHPFATTSNSIDEDLAQKNVYQTRGVPSRVRAEHEALRKRILETARADPDFQLPNLENSGAQAWKTLDETPESSGTLSGDEGELVNGIGGINSPRNVGVQGGPRNGISESRYRTIDFSGEEQGSGRS